MKKIILLTITLIFLLPSCITRKACERKFPSIEHDSISFVTNTVTVYRDTTVYIKLPGDTVYESIPIGEGVSVLKTPFAKSYAWVKDGRLEHRVEQEDTVINRIFNGAIRIKEKSEKLKTKVENNKNANHLFDSSFIKSSIKIFIIFMVLILVLRMIRK